MPERGKQSPVITWTSLLTKFSRRGLVNEARTLFDILPHRNVVTYNAMLSGYVQSGRLSDACKFFEAMPKKNVVSWTSMLCGLMNGGMIEDAKALFEAMPDRNIVSWNSMVVGLVRNGMLEEARLFFEAMPIRDAVSWNAMINGYAENGWMEKAKVLFDQMVDKNVITWTTLISGYCRAGEVWIAYDLFRKMPGKNVVSWTAMVSGLSWNCYYEEAILLALEMRKEGVKLHKETCISLAFACAGIGSARLVTSMISGYFNDGQIVKACELFGIMTDKDNIAWTVMISGYVQNELFIEAMCLFSEMWEQGVIPLQSTYSTLLGAAGAAAHLHQGRQLHCLLIKSQMNMDLILENSLISMYGKCGQVGEAYQIFSSMSCHDVVSWNSILMGFSIHALAYETLSLFDSMQKSRIKPNSVTFLGLLSACSHAGLMKEGWQIYKDMNAIYGIQPDLEHYICMVNLLGRAGNIKEAEQFVLGLPSEQGIAVWGALLGMCGISDENTEIGGRVLQRLLELDPMNAPGYVVHCNMLAASGKYGEERVVRKEMRSKGIRKVPGCSWISTRESTYVFFSSDTLKSQM
ncbi:hypothetical protein RDABS01_029420 [Bienertia sinuspersici]